MANRETLEKALVNLMISLGISEVRGMTVLAIIRAHQIQEEMAFWAASYYGKEDTLTIQAFMSKLNELTDTTEME